MDHTEPRAPAGAFPTACSDLLGEQWRTMLPAVSALLGISHRTVQRWAAGRDVPPLAVLDRLDEFRTIARQARADSERARASHKQCRRCQSPGDLALSVTGQFERPSPVPDDVTGFAIIDCPDCTPVRSMHKT